MTLTKQFGRNGDAGGWGAYLERVWREQVYTLFLGVLLKGRVEKWGTFSHCRERGLKDDYKMEEITCLYDDQKHPTERVKLWHRERRKNYWNECMNSRESENSESKLLLVSFKILSKEKCAKRSQYKLSIQNYFR